MLDSDIDEAWQAGYDTAVEKVLELFRQHKAHWESSGLDVDFNTIGFEKELEELL